MTLSDAFGEFPKTVLYILYHLHVVTVCALIRTLAAWMVLWLWLTELLDKNFQSSGCKLPFGCVRHLSTIGESILSQWTDILKNIVVCSVALFVLGSCGILWAKF